MPKITMLIMIVRFVLCSLALLNNDANDDGSDVLMNAQARLCEYAHSRSPPRPTE